MSSKRSKWNAIFVFLLLLQACMPGRLTVAADAGQASGLGVIPSVYGDGKKNVQPVTSSVYGGVKLQLNNMAEAGDDLAEVYSFGPGGNGKLGYPNNDWQPIPKYVEAFAGVPVVDVVAGNGHSLALTSDGKVYAFGYGRNGQLGHGQTTDLGVPTLISFGGPGDKAAAVSAGYNHSLIVTVTGDVYAFGTSAQGALGLGELSDNVLSPTRIPLNDKVVSIAAGNSHSLLLTENGEIYSTGNGLYGRTGLGYEETVYAPVKITAGLPSGVKVKAVSAGNTHSLALTEDGKVYAFGDGSYGSSGHGDRSGSVIPKRIDALQNIVVTAVSAGRYYSLALSEDGDVYAFGIATDGQLGLGTGIGPEGDVPHVKVPTAIPRASFAGEKVVAVSAGYNHALALTESRKVYSFGYSNRVGQGDIQDHSYVPVNITPPGVSVKHINAGPSHSFLLTLGPSAFDMPGTPTNIVAVPGNGQIEVSFVPSAYDGGTPITKYTVYAVSGTSVVRADGNASPIVVSGLLNAMPYTVTVTATNIKGESPHSAARVNIVPQLSTAAGEGIFSFGIGAAGQLGQGFYGNLNAPKQILPRTIAEITDIAAGAGHSLVATKSGAIYAFGDGAKGRLGINEYYYDRVWPTPLIVLPEAPATEVAAGGEHSLLATVTGEVYSFGYGAYGELGHGDTSQQDTPKRIQALAGIKIVDVSAGGSHSLALGENGEVYAFGSGLAGQLGLGNNNSTNVPVKIQGGWPSSDKAIAIAAGASHSLVLTDKGEVYSFGGGSAGQLGHGNTQSVNVPTRIAGLPGGDKAVAIHAGGSGSLVLTESGAVYTFGNGDKGELGHGDTNMRTSPTLVAALAGKRAIAASMGDKHTIVVTQEAGGFETYSFGKGDFGVLGHGASTNLSKVLPTRIGALSGKRIALIAAGGYHTVVLAGGSGETEKPAITGAVVAPRNAYADVTFSEGVYAKPNGAGGLWSGSFRLAFAANGGGASGAAITAVRKPNGETADTAGMLTGGETKVRVFIAVTGVPSGVESIELKPVNGLAIYDGAGNAAEAVQSAVRQLRDLVPPVITNVVRANDTTVEVTLSKDAVQVEHDHDGGFTVQESDSGGSITYPVTRTTAGADSRKVVLTVADTGGSGKEGLTVHYSQGVNGTIADTAGNALASTAAGIRIAAWDTAAPAFATAVLAAGGNAYVDVTFTEDVYGNADGTGVLTAADFRLDFRRNSGNATGASIAAVKNTGSDVPETAGDLAGGERTVRLFLTTTGTPSGAEQIDIRPKDGQSLFDKAGNPAAAGEIRTLTLKDKLAPSITGVTKQSDVRIIVDLSQDATGATKNNDGGFKVTETGNDSVTYAVTSIDQIPGQARKVALTIANMAVSGKEGVTVSYGKGGNGTIADEAGNLMESSAGWTIGGWNRISPMFDSVSQLGYDNTSFDLYFTKGVYASDNGTGGLKADDFTLLFEANGGTATGAVIEEVQRVDIGTGEAAGETIGGEYAVRIFIAIEGTPDGNETVMISPADGQAIFDIAGNAVQESDSQTVTVFEKYSPTMAEAVRESDTTIVVKMSELIYFDDMDTSGGFVVQETGSGGTVAYGVNSVALLQDDSYLYIVLTVDPMGASGKEGVTVKYVSDAISDPIMDWFDNRLETDATGVPVAAWDNDPPILQAEAALDEGNAYVDITFSEGVYGTAQGTGGLTAASVAVDFAANGGAAAGASVAAVKKADGGTADAAGALTGGETTVRVFLAYDGAPNGTETVALRPASGLAIFDKAGHAADVTRPTNAKTLADRLAPTINGAVVDTNNAFVDIAFSEGIYGAANGTGGIAADRLELTFAANGGSAAGASVAGVKKPDGVTAGTAGALAGGETTVRVFLTLSGVPGGLETVTIRPTVGAAIFDAAGNAIAADASSGPLPLTDRLAPVMAAAVRDIDTQITVELSEPVTLPVASGGFTVEETGSGGTKTYPITAAVQGADAAHIVLTVADTGASGKEGLGVKYTAGLSGGIADAAGNAMATDATGVLISAWDTEPPELQAETVLGAGNAYIDITFNEGVFGTQHGAGGVTAAGLALDFAANGGIASGASILDVRKSDGETATVASALTGGETTVRVFLAVTGVSSGTETVALRPANGLAIFDKAGNAADATRQTNAKMLADRLVPTITGAELGSKNAYVDVTFSEGVYAAALQSGALTEASLAVEFAANGGTASGASIIAVRKADGTTVETAGMLAGGETKVRVFIGYAGSPSGVEQMVLRPASGTSIFDQAGNPMQASEITAVLELADGHAPFMKAAVRDSDTQITVELSEQVTLPGPGGFAVEEAGSGGTKVYPVTAAVLGADATHVVLTVADMGVSGKEGVIVKYTAGLSGGIADAAGNAMTTDETGTSVRAWDTEPPLLQTEAVLGAGNTYIDISYSEGVYGSAQGAGGLTATSLAVDFAASGGGAAGASIEAVKKPDGETPAAAGALAGGETTVRVFLTYEGTPSGVETIALRPSSGLAIFDKAGNTADASRRTNAKTLEDRLAPVMKAAVRDSDTQITVELSEPVVLSGTGGFTVEETGSGGKMIYPVSAAVLGTDAAHVVLTVADMGVSGKEGVTVKYTAGSSGRVTDAAGNMMATDEAGVPVLAWDTAAPVLQTEAVLETGNAYIDISFSEGVYGSAQGAGGLTATSLAVDFAANGGGSAGVSIEAVKKPDGEMAAAAGALAGGETKVRVFLSYDGTPSGTETIALRPASGFAIFDKAGNAADATRRTNAKTLADRLAPFMKAAVRDGDTQINVELSEPVVLSGPGGFTVEETGSGGTKTYPVTAAVLSADASHIVLTIADMSVSGKEGVTVKYSAGSSGGIADTAGNAMATDGTGTSIPAWDTEPPVLQTEAVLGKDNAYIDIAFSEGVYGSAQGAGGLTVSSLAVDFAANGGGAAGVSIEAVMKPDGETAAAAAALTGGETRVRVFLTVMGTPSGAETVAVRPADGASIFDIAGNAAEAARSTIGLRLASRQAPVSGGNETDEGTGAVAIPPANDDKRQSIPVIVNGVVQQQTATALVETVNDRKRTTVTLQEEPIGERLKNEEAGAVFTVPVTNGSDQLHVELNGRMVRDMEDKSAVLHVQTEAVAYAIPAGFMNIDAVSGQFGSQADLRDIKVRVEIAIVPNEPKPADSPDGTAVFVSPVVQFRVTATWQDREIEIEQFAEFVERTIVVPADAAPGRITTGVRIGEDGQLLHVPTKVVEQGGAYRAVINSLSNSRYSVIYNEKTFEDIRGHWSREAVEKLSSRLVIGGTDERRFMPDQPITRAEFVAIMARALGLHNGNEAASFQDVPSDAWYAGVVAIAERYGLIEGERGGSFRPQDRITREEAMVVATRAMKLAGMPTRIDNAETDRLLAAYQDADAFGDWSKSAAGINIRYGIIQGYSSSLAPKAFISRAETAAVVARLLKTAELTD